ncbi:hypothetical protein GCM10023115_52220 [Pontixanthobacter gangjinensis]|uniref:Uncharacterized protein n=1 Tax=Christiangramia aestuarii TaxID=1028746 RepID=A0A7K1LPS5_9FLAO|nr:hypothetical protein [Christiangramia aestuarii]MUP42802.1 hypothetical protein [Christiangramia aestuarii]
MAEEKNKEQADWQKNAGRPSNFHEKDDKLKKDGDGNLKVKNEDKRVTKEEDKTIQETLDSISESEDKD